MSRLGLVLGTLLTLVAGHTRTFSPSRMAAHRGPTAAMSAAGSQTPRGFIGLGIMGQGMARCLLRAGYPLHVWTRNASVAAALQAEGLGPVTLAASPSEVVRACDRTFLMLSTPEVCKEVYTMRGGVLEGVAPGKALVDCATLRPEDMGYLESEVLARGGRFVEAPVSGSKGPAEQGSLIFMTAVRDLPTLGTHETY